MLETTGVHRLSTAGMPKDVRVTTKVNGFI